DDGSPREAAPTVKPAGGSLSQSPCDTTPAPSTGQPEPGNWGCRHVSALPDCKSSREEVPPTDRRSAALSQSPASTPHRHRKDRRFPACQRHAESRGRRRIIMKITVMSSSDVRALVLCDCRICGMRGAKWLFRHKMTTIA